MARTSSGEIRAILADDRRLTELTHAAFQAADTDGSGFIEHAELKIVMTSIANDIGMDAPSDKDVQDVLFGLDENGDGRISPEEFKVLIRHVLELLKNQA